MSDTPLLITEEGFHFFDDGVSDPYLSLRLLCMYAYLLSYVFDSFFFVIFYGLSLCCIALLLPFIVSFFIYLGYAFRHVATSTFTSVTDSYYIFAVIRRELLTPTPEHKHNENAFQF